VLGYVLARDSEGHDGDAFRLQAEAIDHACAGRGLQLVGLVRDCESENGGSAPPPGLNHALERVGAGEAGGLVVARLEDLGTSTAGLGALVEWLANPDARLVAADLDLDTGTETGRLATLLSLSELERRRLAAPTREDMAGSQLFPGGRGALRPVRDDGDDEHSAGGEQTQAARYKRPAKKPPRDHHADSLSAEDETAGREEGESWAR
jgi:DNA invertase Pin-like site-specific DNA recombinase